MVRKGNFEGYHIRKWYTQIEDSLANETGELADGEPLRKMVIAAALHNPYAGRFSENLDDLVRPSPALGMEFARRIGELAANRKIESYGKACLVGSAGEWVVNRASKLQVCQLARSGNAAHVTPARLIQQSALIN